MADVNIDAETEKRIFDAFAAWVKETYGTFSWQYNHLGGLLGTLDFKDWWDDPVFTEWANAGHPGLFTDEEVIAQEETSTGTEPTAPEVTYQNLTPTSSYPIYLGSDGKYYDSDSQEIPPETAQQVVNAYNAELQLETSTSDAFAGAPERITSSDGTEWWAYYDESGNIVSLESVVADTNAPLAGPPTKTFQDGEYWWIYYDTNGNISKIEKATSETTEMTEYEKAQYDLQLQQLEFEREQWEYEQSQSGVMTPYEQAQAKQWAAEQYAESYGGEEDWIKRWYYDWAMQNPEDAAALAESNPDLASVLPDVQMSLAGQGTPSYAGEITTPFTAYAGGQGEQAQQGVQTNEVAKLIQQYGPAWALTDEDWNNWWASNGIDIEAAGYDRYMGNSYQWKSAWEAANPDSGTFEDYIALNFGGEVPEGFWEQWGMEAPTETGEEFAGTIGVQEPKEKYYKKPGAPPAPHWLEEYTGIAPGQAISPTATKLASGQSLSALNPSELGGLSGYIDWSAGRVAGAPASYEDWMYESQELLPKRTPTRTYAWNVGVR